MYDVTFSYYLSEYKGIRITTADAFDRLSLRAIAYIDLITRGKAAEAEAVKNAICAVADEFMTTEEGGGVLSERVGPWTRTYAKNSTTEGGRYFAAARLWLPDLVKAGYWV